MTKERNAGLEDVAGLMLERQRLESWIASLDARKGNTPPEVYQRVRGDYAARLRTVTEQLLARRAAVQSHLESLSTRLTQLESKTQRVQNERAESELRMQVGELSVTDWNIKVRECDEAVARLTEAQTQVRGQLTQARGVLSMVGAEGNGGSPATGTPANRAGGPRASRPLNADQVRDAEGASMDELEFLKSVVGGQTAETPAAPASAGEQEEQPEGAPDLAETLLDRVNRRGGPGKLREESDAESLVQGGKESTPITPKPNPLAANVTESNPIVLRPQGGLERHKTLKCNECGTMNYPTEWYCERCGGELAAL